MGAHIRTVRCGIGGNLGALIAWIGQKAKCAGVAAGPWPCVVRANHPVRFENVSNRSVKPDRPGRPSRRGRHCTGHPSARPAPRTMRRPARPLFEAPLSPRGLSARRSGEPNALYVPVGLLQICACRRPIKHRLRATKVIGLHEEKLICRPPQQQVIAACELQRDLGKLRHVGQQPRDRLRTDGVGGAGRERRLGAGGQDRGQDLW